MARISFESIETAFTILNPQKDFSEELHRLEVRYDPLLGDRSVYNPFLRDKARVFYGDNDHGLIRKLAEESTATCIFCGERVEQCTPKYPPHLAPEGRIRSGEALLFPNLFSIGTCHAVVALCRAHFLELSGFSPGLLSDGLLAARTFLQSLVRNGLAGSFVTVNANYLSPAGASLVHPHLQMLVTPTAYSYHARLFDACRSYWRTHGSAYHADLAIEERKAGVRYIAQRGQWHWIAAFSPMGSNEIMAVHEKESDYARLSEDDIQDLAYGISKALSFYESIGHISFNFSLFAVRQPEAGEGSRCLLKLINRQNLYPNYRNDDYFLQKLLQTELIINLPEELAPGLRATF